MALKAVLDKLDGLADTVKALYKSVGAQFVLDIEGELPGFVAKAAHDTVLSELATIKPKAEKIGEFRDNNIALSAALKRFGVDDPTKAEAVATEFLTLKANADGLKGKGVKDAADIAKIVEDALKPLADKLLASEAARLKSDAAAADASLTTTLTAAALKSGVLESAVPDAIRRARDVFRSKDGVVTPFSGDDVLRDTKGDAVKPESWFAETLSKEAAHLFKPSGGAGADNTTSTRQAGARQVSVADPLAFGRNAADIATGKAQVIQ